jgi:hypothetical protein
MINYLLRYYSTSPPAGVPMPTRGSSFPDDLFELTSDGKRRRERGNPKYTREYKANLSLTAFQVEVLVGLLLGDYFCF